MEVLFIAGFGPIVDDLTSSRRLYEEALGIEFQAHDDYLHTDALEGANAFALWPLAQAAESTFGRKEWPAEVPRPQAWLEFDVEDIESATAELEAKGYRLLVSNRTEPWGQRVTRLLSPEGLLVGVTETPWMRETRA